MRLLFVSHSFAPRDAPLSNVGGMQRVATELHSALEARDDVSMRTVALRSSWKWVHIKAVPFLVLLAVRLGREAVAYRADTILFTSMTTALPLLIAGPALKRKGIRLVAIVHGLDVTDPNPVYQMAVRRLCGMLDAVMPVSGATGEELVARGLPRERVHVVPNAVDLDRFEGVADSRAETARVHIAGAPPLPDDAFLLVTVGRQVRRKGFVWFIENVMPKLPDRVIFWLAGDGPERENIEAAIQRAGLQQRVRCLGKISEEELVELYRRGNLFVMPNIVVPGDMEGFGIVMLEAGACGLPTLAADLEGIRDVIDEGVNGWYAPTEDADAFAARIQSLLDDPDVLREASERTVEYVTKTFRWDSTAQRYLDALRPPVPLTAKVVGADLRVMQLRSDSFNDGDYIPTRYALGKRNAEGKIDLTENKNPHLAWSGLPEGTKSIAVLCYDRSAPTKPDDVNQEGRLVPADLPRADFAHWVLVDVAPDAAITEGTFSDGPTPHGKDGPAGPMGTRSGINDYTGWFGGDPDMAGDYYGYDGPCPPFNDAIVHRYDFTAYALDVDRVPVEGKFTGPDVLSAIEGHILGEAEIGFKYTINPNATEL